MENEKWQVIQHGKLLFEGSNFQCYKWILDHQPQSVDWAMRYCGYRIVKADGSSEELVSK